MSAQHTPGPWVTADGHGPIKGGTAVQSTHDTYLICSCTGYYGRDGAQANARLIAAAPELLEVLERAYTVFGDFRHDWNGRHTPAGQVLLSAMRDTIAKATGRDEEDVQNDYGTRQLRKEQA